MIIKYLPVFVILSVLLVSCGPSTEKAIEYNDALVAEHAAVTENIQMLFQDISGFNMTRIDEDYNNTKESIKISTGHIEDLGDFYGDDSYKNAFIEYMDHAGKMIDNEVKQVIDILKLGDKITAVDEEKLNQLTDKIYNKEKEANKNLELKQAEFSEKYEFDLK
ncbi:MAG: hypothetical protein A2W91_18840 [Bacteroidetes bacterium GWF2_38_335]|nr:MAG: hypothetical protein A2W91_18840 [Bacteroidetes bacterium GWF2_38_335]OFY78145.1 MAG: hypothetical protein A2281_04225 [Bacteroidetes bacterium RIFOXYA12_FULL_38_20]HBS88700.1 hypothetical protein [Bacteroidales bacterium]